MDDMRTAVNLQRRYIATLTDLVWYSAGREDSFAWRHYADKRTEAAEELNAMTADALASGEFTEDEAARAVSPIASVDTAAISW